MTLNTALRYILILTCLAMCGALLWIPFTFHMYLKPSHIAIFITLAATSLTPIILVIYQSRKK